MPADPIRWLRLNLPFMAAAAFVIAGVIGASGLVLSVSHRETPLREAEVSLAGLEGLSGALLMHPLNVVDRGGAAASDLTVNGELRTDALGAARTVERRWPGASATRILALARETATLSGLAVERVRAGRLVAGRRLLAPLAQRAETLGTTVRAARGKLAGEIEGVEGDERNSVLAVVGGLGLALVAVMSAVAISRRRRIRAEAERTAVRHSERRLQALVRHGSDMITVVSPDTTVLYEAGAVESMLGYRPAELEGHRLRDWVHPDDASALLGLCAAANGGGSARELRLFHRDGSERICEARATSLLGDELWNGIVLNIWDVSERKALEERLRHQAFHDRLTGLANRALFGDRLEHALQRGRRSGAAVSVLLVDLDDFKSINDSLGHAAGDRLLTEVAGRLGDAMRAADTIARLGGDEFAVILEESASEPEDERAAQRILDALAPPVRLGERSFPVTASVGIARGGPGETDAGRLVRDADLAMYAAKAEQKGTFALYRPDMHIATEERLALKADLAHALTDGGQLELCYQPVVSLQGEGIVGLEALLRWNHPTRGQIAPEEFIPLAEETGAIIPIGRWVLREACRQGAAWDRGSTRELSIAVNVSSRQILTDGGLLADVREALRESGLPAERLVLEITETALMQNVERASEALREVKRLGVRIAIDDFGTGYSSLSQLEKLPVDILKVDREFAGTPEDRAEHAKLLRAVMEIGSSLHLRTVAEGIETPEQLAEMKALHYPLGQGFLFSRPLPVSAVGAMLAAEEEREGEGGEQALEAPPGSALGGQA